MAAIHAIAFPHDPWSESSFFSLLSQSGVDGFIDERGGVVMLRSVADEAEILTIGVTALRQGIGSELMQIAIAHARARHAAALHLEVAASNAAARGLYESLGFKQTGERRKYYADGGDALLLSLAIS